MDQSAIPLLASPQGGVAERLRKCCEASADSEAGVVFRMRTKGKPPRLRQVRWLRAIFLMTQPPLLAVMQGGEYARISDSKNRHTGLIVLMTICGHNEVMTKAKVSELKARLSAYLAEVRVLSALAVGAVIEAVNELESSVIPLLASPQGGVDASSRKWREATEPDADGVVFLLV